MDTMTSPQEQQADTDDRAEHAGLAEEDVPPAAPAQSADDDEFAPTIVRGRE